MTVKAVFQGAFGAYSRLLPGASAATARKLMTTPRLSNEVRVRATAMADETLALGADSWLSVRRGGDRVLLLVHGWSSGIGHFEALLAAFPRAIYTVYMVHPAGHGPSTAKRSHPGRFIDAIRLALAHIGEPVDVAIGHSMGAGALGFVAAHDGGIDRLVLVSGPATFEAVLRRFARFINLGPTAEQRFLAGMEAFVGLPLEALNIAALLGPVPVASLVVHDRSDREIPFADSELLCGALQHCEHLPTDGLGHNRILRDEAVIRRIADFAAGVDGLAGEGVQRVTA
ncbi:MAG: alpha/beta fold hydrolase [Marinobacter sp.]|nr:alpha/beta fold hydrolase [Marinobacter sp.]